VLRVDDLVEQLVLVDWVVLEGIHAEFASEYSDLNLRHELLILSEREVDILLHSLAVKHRTMLLPQRLPALDDAPGHDPLLPQNEEVGGTLGLQAIDLHDIEVTSPWLLIHSGGMDECRLRKVMGTREDALEVQISGVSFLH
jgi:hypothetical protein